jgi:imidazolonepropionase-like amidohydrolase
MKRRLLPIFIAITIIFVSLQSAFYASPAYAQVANTAKISASLLIRGGWVFDGITDKRRPNRGIFIQNGIIKAIDVPEKYPVGKNTTIIELNDEQTVLPGMIDLHAHYNFDFLDQGRVEEVAYNGLVFLANGVTTTWSAGEFNPERVIDQRRLIESGQAIGPTLLSSGPYFGGFRCEYSVKTAADDCIAWPNDITDQEIRDEVDYWAKKNITSIKIKQATPHEMRIIIDQADKNGLTTTGHLANYDVEYDVTTQEAIEMGIDRIEHQLMLALSPEEADIKELSHIVSLMIEHQVFYGANLQMYGSVNLRAKNAADMLWVDEAQYFTPYAQKLLKKRGPPPPESDWPEYRQRVIELMALYEAGGSNLLIVGTDEPVYTTLLPGFAYHRELFALNDAGLPPSVVLKAATINGARALGIDRDVGSVEENKIADLNIINGNPLVDIKNVRNIKWVIKNGVAHNPKALLEGVEGTIGPRDEQDHPDWILTIPPLRLQPIQKTAQ